MIIHTDNRLNIFISWSGELAGNFAEQYKSFINNIINDKNEYVNVFFSRDIEKSKQWFQEISQALSRCEIGIILLTPESIKSNWVHYEAGIMINSQYDENKNIKVFPILIGIDKDSNKAFQKSPIHLLHCTDFKPESDHRTIEFLEEIILSILEKIKDKYTDKNLNITDRTILQSRKDEIEEQGRPLHETLKNKFKTWKQGHKKHLPDIELVDYKDSKNQFSNFVNDYIAFNAPLVYEQQGNRKEEALQEHLDRYKEHETKAEYFYPIFSILDHKGLYQWLKNIYPFFKKINENLEDKERKLITFYAPKFQANPFDFLRKFSYDLGFTFFVGDKKDDSELVCLYMHNRIYSNLSSQNSLLVKKYFLIRNSDDCESHKNIVVDEDLRDTSTGMVEMNLEKFLNYCEEIMNKLESENL